MQIHAKANNRSQLNKSQRKHGETNKEAYFRFLLDYAREFFAPMKDGEIKTADDWLRLCLDSKCEKVDSLNIINQLSRNESQYFGKVFPRGFQKALAVGFIMEKQDQAFKGGRFKLDDFKNMIQSSNKLFPIEKNIILANLEDKYFKHITYYENTQSDGSHPKVSFGKTEYKNILSLPGTDQYSILIYDNMYKYQTLSFESISKEQQIEDFFVKFTKSGLLTSDSAFLSIKGLQDKSTKERLMTLSEFINDQRFLLINKDFKLCIEGIPVEEFFNALKQALEDINQHYITQKVNQYYTELDEQKRRLIDEFFSSLSKPCNQQKLSSAIKNIETVRIFSINIVEHFVVKYMNFKQPIGYFTLEKLAEIYNNLDKELNRLALIVAHFQDEKNKNVTEIFSRIFEKRQDYINNFADICGLAHCNLCDS